MSKIWVNFVKISKNKEKIDTRQETYENLSRKKEKMPSNWFWVTQD